MAKDKDTNNPQLEQLQQDGHIVLTAKTRDDLFAQVETLKASAKGAALATGAIGQNRESGDFSIRVDIINN